MKKYILLMFLLVAFTVFGENGKEINVITVTGEAELKVEPNEAVITAAVETNSKNIDEARKISDESIKSIADALIKEGIEKKEIQAARINVEPRYNYENNSKTFAGYFITRTITVNIKDLAKFDIVYSTLLKKGVNYVYNIKLTSSEMNKYRDEVRKNAAKNGKAKADMITSVLGRKTGKAVVIIENGGYQEDNQDNGRVFGVAKMRADVSDGGQGGVLPGEITLKESINITFEME